MIRGNTRKFLDNIYHEFDSYYGSSVEEVEEVKANCISAGSYRNFVEGGCFYCYYSEAFDFLARVYENTEKEKEEFSKIADHQIWERFVNVVCLYLPKWIKSKGVNV